MASYRRKQTTNGRAKPNTSTDRCRRPDSDTLFVSNMPAVNSSQRRSRRRPIIQDISADYQYQDESSERHEQQQQQQQQCADVRTVYGIGKKRRK